MGSVQKECSHGSECQLCALLEVVVEVVEEDEVLVKMVEPHLGQSGSLCAWRGALFDFLLPLLLLLQLEGPNACCWQSLG